MMKLLLASKSPRRRELIAGLGLPFEVVSAECEETYPADLTEGNIPLFIAREKASAYKKTLHPGEVLVTADTIVWLDGQVLGKPCDEDEAVKMLRSLSGTTHQVYTGVCLRSQNKEESFVSRTDVTFRHFTDEEIYRYIREYRPYDKAGAYGIQEWIGYIGCTAISGSFYNVMGLPTARLFSALKSFQTE